MTLDNLNDISFWRKIALECSSKFTVNEPEIESYDPIDMTQVDLPESGEQLKKEGYIHLKGLFSDIEIDSYKKMAQALYDRGIPPVFLSIYDQFWLLSHRLENVIAPFLGKDALVLPRYFVWLVDPSEEEAGFGIEHRDYPHIPLNKDGSPNHLSVWIPLSESNVYNGCMYIVPANRDPFYLNLKQKEKKIEYCNIRALPGDAGDLFLWNNRVLHWSSKSSNRKGIEPRISIAFEYISRTFFGQQNEFKKVVPFDFYPSFESRKELIAYQMSEFMWKNWPDLFVSFMEEKLKTKIST